MSVENFDVIDSIGINNEIVTLAISDHLDWEKEYDHLIKLQEKINAYIGFIESEEIYDVYPLAKNKKPRIKVFFKYELTLKAQEFIEFTSKRLNEIGVILNFQVLK